MLKKLRKLYTVLSEKKHKVDLGPVDRYAVVVVYFPHLEQARIELLVTYQNEKIRSFKYGDVPENFDLAKYINECIEDLKN